MQILWKNHYFPLDEIMKKFKEQLLIFGKISWINYSVNLILRPYQRFSYALPSLKLRKESKSSSFKLKSKKESHNKKLK